MAQHVEWIEPYYVKEDGSTLGPLYLRLSVENATEMRKIIGVQAGRPYENDQEALDDFLIVHYGRIIEVNE